MHETYTFNAASRMSTSEFVAYLGVFTNAMPVE